MDIYETDNPKFYLLDFQPMEVLYGYLNISLSKFTHRLIGGRMFHDSLKEVFDGLGNHIYLPDLDMTVLMEKADMFLHNKTGIDDSGRKGLVRMTIMVDGFVVEMVASLVQMNWMFHPNIYIRRVKPYFVFSSSSEDGNAAHPPTADCAEHAVKEFMRRMHGHDMLLKDHV